jgi:hypothetical protein
MELFGEYLIQRHSTLTVCMTAIDFVSSSTRVAVAELRKRSLEAAMTAPETSTLLEYESEFGRRVPCVAYN